MAAILVHGYVQLWNRKKGMSKSKEAFIETVVGKDKVKLLLYFNTGSVKTLLLSDIKNVILRSYGENRNDLYLTLQNNDFLFIERLAFTDAQQLKAFLDSVCETNLQPPMRSDKGEGIFTSTTTQKEINKTSLNKDCKKTSSGCFETAEETKTSYLQKMPLFIAKSPTPISKKLLEKQQEKRKRILFSSSDRNENKTLLIEDNSIRNKKSKADSLECISHNWEKQLKFRESEENEKSAFEFSFMADFTGNSSRDDTHPQTFAEKIFFPFLVDPNSIECGLDWENLEMFLAFCPEKVCHGLPNLGNTCYMNAVLQSLCSIPSFINDILSQSFQWSRVPRDAFSMCLAQLLVLKDVYDITMKGKVLRNIKRAISEIAEIFSGDIQNDAHEFLSFCLNHMKETIQKLSVTQEDDSGKETSPHPSFADNAATKSLLCPVITNFELELLGSIFCKGCGRAVLKTEPSNYLSINLPQGRKVSPLSIQSSIDLFFRAEEIEYKCERCKHRQSVTMYKFSRLPRILIVHLKRYSFNEMWSLRKDEQKVIVSKYVKLSSHCNGNTKLPLPLSKNAHIRDLELLKIFQKMTFEMINSPTPSAELISKSKESLSLHFESDKELEPQKSQRFFKKASREQQKDLEKDSKLNIMESGDEMLFEEELFTDSMYLEDDFISLIHKDGGKPASSPDICIEDNCLQEIPENSKLDKYENTNVFIDFDSVSEPFEDFDEDPHPTFPESFPRVAQQIQRYDGGRIHKEAPPHQALPQSLPELNAQGHTQNFRSPTKLNLQKANLNSDKNPGNHKTESKAKEPKGNADKGDPHTYRLIGVISHLGNTPHSGHYISDAYDFKTQQWFTYNDVQVSSIPEFEVQESRISTGYIFFYMYNEAFEQLLARGQNSRSCSTKAKKTS
ncbi:ubiquitin carboxyl-terminal hydrolase 26 [Castor canadensis]|uniref:ubiquitin carboxyl-terminal hydrolase 26 n=1 Tax=Castor canadensis TaxID=51338 RepID=UPI003D162575